MPKPKVTILCQLFYPELVSTGQTLTELGEELSSMDVDVEVVCGPPSVVDRSRPPREMEHNGILIHRTWGTQFPKLSLPGKLSNLVTFALSSTCRVLLSRDASPLLILTNPPFLAVAGVLCRWIRRRPYIFLVFDVYPDVGRELGVIKPGGLLERAWDVLNRVLYRNASHVIVLGRCMADVVRRPNKLGPLAEDRLHVIHMWSDDRTIRAVPRSSSNLLKEWGLEDKFVVQYSGNMGRIHDIETILQAAWTLRERRDIHFQFIGEGYKKRLVQSFLQEKQLGTCSVRTYVPREQLPDSLAAASVGIVSLLPACTGLAVPSKIYGVMAAGRPVIGLMDPGGEAARAVMGSESGVILQPGDVQGLVNAIVDLAGNPEKCREMGERGRRAIDERYSLHAAALQYREVIASLQ